MIGRVVSVKMVKSAVVIVERTKTHPLYKKSYVQTKKYLVDDQMGVKLGDVIIFEKTRPISKNKHWRITKVLGADFVSLQEAELKESAIEAIEEVLPEIIEEAKVVADSQLSEAGEVQAESTSSDVHEADQAGSQQSGEAELENQDQPSDRKNKTVKKAKTIKKKEVKK